MYWGKGNTRSPHHTGVIVIVVIVVVVIFRPGRKFELDGLQQEILFQFGFFGDLNPIFHGFRILIQLFFQSPNFIHGRQISRIHEHDRLPG